jgi:hypothetical protein
MAPAAALGAPAESMRKAQRRQDKRVALYGRDEHTGGYGDPPY